MGKCLIVIVLILLSQEISSILNELRRVQKQLESKSYTWLVFCFVIIFLKMDWECNVELHVLNGLISA